MIKIYKDELNAIVIIEGLGTFPLDVLEVSLSSDNIQITNTSLDKRILFADYIRIADENDNTFATPALALTYVESQLENTSSSAVADHGGLTGLNDDDHPQYLTNARFDTRLATKDTDDLTEGSLNLYYTEARVDSNSNVSANTSHRNSTSNPHSVTAAQIGAIPTTEKGQNNGVATLGSDGKLTTSQIPAAARPEFDVVADITARDALTVQEGDESFVVSTQKYYIYDGTSWIERVTDPDSVTSSTSSSANNRIARYDGTSGKVIKQSSIEITDSGDMTGVGTINGVDVSVLNTSTNSHIADTSNPHDTSLDNLVGSDLSALNALISNATLDDVSSPRQPTNHASTHAQGGSDELEVVGLSSGAETANKIYVTDGTGGHSTQTISSLSGIEHGNLSGLGDDDHPQYINNTRFDTRFSTKDTDDLPEGSSNLYYTDARASAASPIQSVNGDSGPVVVLDKNDIGLGNVPNQDATNRTNHTGVQPASTITGLGAVATSNDYDDLTNKPSIPSQSEVDANTSHAGLTNNPHATDIGNLGSGTLAELNSAITDGTLDTSSDSRPPNAHASSHSQGGSDEINVSDLGSGSATAGQALIADGSGGVSFDTVIGSASGYRDIIWAEESAALSSTVGIGFQWSFGNGDETPQNQGIVMPRGGSISKLILDLQEGSATVFLYINGNATTASVSASGTNSKAVADVSGLGIAFAEEDTLNFRTTTASGNTNGGRVGVEIEFGDAPDGYTIQGADDVSGTFADGEAPIWNSVNSRFEPGTASGGGADLSQVGAIAAGYTQGLQQSLLTADGQIGKTVLAVGYTTDGKAQCTSLGEGNVAFTYATGADYLANNPLEGPVFLDLGEIYVFENLSNGSIITFTEGGYGFSGQVNGSDESPMPLLSLGLSFTDTFVFAFRSSNSNEGRIRVVNGPVASSVTLFDGNGVVQLGQQDIELDPWEFLTLSTNGNKEYRIISTNNIMACIHAEMDTVRFYDSRLVMPLTNEGITWPRSGQMSAPYAGTNVKYYVRDGAAWNRGLGAILTVNPGSPRDIDAAQPGGTGANDSDYEPNGATIFIAAGLISAFSGADSAGLEASPMFPTSSFVQRVALPLQIRDGGDGGNNGIAIASKYTGTARVYEWDPILLQATLAYTVPLTRGLTPYGTPEDQKIPAAGLVANETTATVQLVGDYYGGYVEADVPIHVVFNSEQNHNTSSVTRKGTSGANVVAINSDDDEQASTGITPEEIRTIIKRSPTDGYLYIFDPNGTWRQA